MTVLTVSMDQANHMVIKAMTTQHLHGILGKNLLEIILVNKIIRIPRLVCPQNHLILDNIILQYLLQDSQGVEKMTERLALLRLHQNKMKRNR